MAFFFFKRYDKQQAHSQDFSKVGGITLCQTEGTHKIVMLTFLPCLPLCDKKGLQRGSQAPQDPLLLPPTSPATPFGTAIGQLVLDIVCATALKMGMMRKSSEL